MHQDTEQNMAERAEKVRKAYEESRRLFHFFCEGWDAGARRRYLGPAYMAKADERREYERGFHARKGSDAADAD